MKQSGHVDKNGWIWFFVSGSLRIDIGYNKVPNSLQQWNDYGMWITPIKDNKIKPIFLVISTFAGGISAGLPDKICIQLGDMINTLITSVHPFGQHVARSSLAFFINQGYMDLTKKQTGNVTNIIQIVLEHE